jgi:hypothetical protein
MQKKTQNFLLLSGPSASLGRMARMFRLQKLQPRLTVSKSSYQSLAGGETQRSNIHPMSRGETNLLDDLATIWEDSLFMHDLETKIDH